jgi:hypothetical protein
MVQQSQTTNIGETDEEVLTRLLRGIQRTPRTMTFPPLNIGLNWEPMGNYVSPQFTLGQEAGLFPMAEEFHPPAPRSDPFERIENGTLLIAQVQGSLHPSPSPRDVTQNEMDDIRRVSETVGTHIIVSSSWTYDFHLYNSPTRGLILVYMANMSGSEGWYPVTMNMVEGFCCVRNGV